MGFTADGSGTPDPTDQNQERRNRLTFGGSDAGPNGNSAQQAANAYALKANQHDARQAYQLNYGQANQSFDQANADRAQAGQARNQQQDALALQQQAAMGNQPSRAELLGRGLIDQSLQSQLAGAASAKGGPLAQMAAQRQVQQNAAGFQQQGMGQLAAMRAGEMADARNAYMQGATGIRGQDYAGAQQAAGMAGQQAQMAQAQGALEMGQRQLNQQGEEAYDQMGWNTLNSQADRNLQEYQQAEQHWANQANLNQQSKRDSQNLVGQLVGGLAEGVGSIFSDERAKIPLSIDGTSDNGGAMDISEGGSTNAGMLASMTGRGAGGQPGTIGGGGMVGGKVNLGAAGDVQGFGSPSKSVGRGMQGFGRHLMSISDERAKKADDIMSGYKKSLAEGPAVGGSHGAAADDIIAGYKDSLARGPAVRPDDDPQLQAMLDDRYNAERQRSGARPEWLDAYMEEQRAPRKLSYGGPEKGVAGAPKGYAAARAAQQGGYAWGDTAKEDEDRGVAPGTTDFERSTPKLKETEKPLLLSIGRGMRGFGRSMMYSDERAKQAAYQAGARDALGTQARSQVDEQNDLANSALGYSAISPSLAAVQAVRSIGKGIDSYRSQRAAEGHQAPPEPRVPRQPEGSGANMLEITNPSEVSQRAPRQMESFTREAPVAEVQKDANRRGAGFAYAYKDGFRPPEQAPGELNYGPSAQQLEKNPLTATAVKTDPKSGMRMLDTHKLLKNNTASIASLQKQIDNLEARNGR